MSIVKRMIEQAEEQFHLDQLREAVDEPTIEEMLLCSPEFGLKSLVYCTRRYRMSRTIFKKQVDGVDFTCFADFSDPVVPDDIPKLENLEIFVDESRNVIDVLDKSVVTALELEAHERRFDNGIPEAEGERIFSYISVLCRSEVGRRGDAVRKERDRKQAGQSERKRDRKRKG